MHHPFQIFRNESTKEDGEVLCCFPLEETQHLPLNSFKECASLVIGVKGNMNKSFKYESDVRGLKTQVLQFFPPLCRIPLVKNKVLEFYANFYKTITDNDDEHYIKGLCA